MSSQVTFQGRDHAGALEHARQAIVVDPEFWIGYMVSGQAYEQLGQPDLPWTPSTTRAVLGAATPRRWRTGATSMAKAGRTEEARAILKTLEGRGRASDTCRPSRWPSCTRASARRDAAFEWLDRAYGGAGRPSHIPDRGPKWDPYREDPRFAALLARCDFMRTARPETKADERAAEGVECPARRPAR
jgi:hypothetical protein